MKINLLLLAIAIGFAAVFLMAGCSSLDKHVDSCYVFGGSPRYAKSGEVVEFACER